jgi:FkbH-like protein
MTKSGAVKCVVWDLDDTLWEGVLLEGDSLRIPDTIRETVKELDHRGILQSVASRNDWAAAILKLDEFGLSEFFLHPQIGWFEKSWALSEIACDLNIGLDSVMLIDDSPFERDAVNSVYPSVRCIDVKELPEILNSDYLQPATISADGRNRRALYVSEENRRRDEKAFLGPKIDFLRSLNMRLTIAHASDHDLDRAEELTVRTHQLNTTGRTFSREELSRFIASSTHWLLVASLDDRYGTYGRVGLALLQLSRRVWTLKLFLMSCRVMNRNVGNAFLAEIMKAARQARVSLEAEFRATDRNRVMWITYRLAGFRPAHSKDGYQILQHDGPTIPKVPDYVSLGGTI